MDTGRFRQWMAEQPPENMRNGKGRLFVALPRRQKMLARGKTVILRALASLPFISLARAHTPGYHERLMHACSEAGFVPKITREVTSLSTMLYFVASGAGVAIVPNTELRHPKVSYRVISDPEIRVPIAALRANRSRSRALDAFVGLLT